MSGIIRALAVLAVGTMALPVMAAPAPIAGRWLTSDGSGIVVVGPCGGSICGKLARVLRGNAAATDANNPDPALRKRPVLGMPILSGFVAASDDWRGKIYDPRNGKTYKSIVTREKDGTLKVQGCIAFFCQSQTWRPAN